MKSYKLVKPYFAENLPLIIIGISCLLLVDMLQLFIPRIIKWVVDDLTALRIEPEGFLKYALYIVCAALCIGILRYIWRRCLIGTSRRIEEGLRNRLFKHVQTLSATYFDKTRTGDLMAHATNDIMHIRMATGMGIVALTDAVFLGTAAIGFMCYINVRLTLFALIPMPLLVLSARFFGKRMHGMYQTVQGSFADLTEVVRERFAGVRIVKAYNLEKDSYDRLDKMSNTYIRENLRLVKITGSFFPLMLLFTNLSLAFVIFFGGRKTIMADITPGDFVAFINYLNLMTWPMMALGWVTNMLQRGAASLDRIDKILKTEPEIHDPEAAELRDHDLTSLRLNQVSFSHDGDTAPVLSGVEFKLDHGETLGIVGPPGSGKTTLLNLIPRLYDVSNGAILLGNTDIKHIKLEALRSGISVVAQEPFLFSGSIRENISFGCRDVDEETLIKAAKQASLYDTIRTFPKGFDTIVGEKGVILSGGQKQRIALARAFIMAPSVLLLDDPVSQVDMETGANIIATIQAMAGKRITVITSHRLSALSHADLIIVLEGGVVTASGNHEQLLNSNPYYEKSFRMQEIEERHHAS
ncbi:MAG: ABC transporter ATP-binding protein [Desulfobacterales bacterium]|nr:ABC transporter ATP-binding protein [Desulfobacterales bacterium]